MQSGFLGISGLAEVRDVRLRNVGRNRGRDDKERTRHGRAHACTVMDADPPWVISNMSHEYSILEELYAVQRPRTSGDKRCGLSISAVVMCAGSTADGHQRYL